MKSAPVRAAWIAPAFCACGTPLLAQLRDNSEKQMTCDNGSRNGDRPRHCEIREQTVASMGRLGIDPGQNGGVSVKGWLRSDVLVRSRVEASADSEAAAATLASHVSVDSSGGQVRATGPQSVDDSYWSVSYEIFVPQNTDLSLKAHNGGISISDIRGQLHFETQNGGVNLKRVAGDVSGSTVNGGVNVELTGAIWEGRQLDVSTQNGGVNLKMPSYYSAHLQAETVNGGIRSDFPMAMEGNRRPKKVDMNVGSGGPLIHLATQNGGLSLKKVDAQ
jgi:DUF4097 and DUF4098 domain-containing protein YvlB